MRRTNIFFKSVLMIICISVLATGCGLFFNPSGYVKVTLDALYKGELENYSKVTSTPIAHAQDQYEAGYKSQADTFATVYGFTDIYGNINMSDQIRSEVENLYKELYSEVQYTIDEHYEKINSEYKVNVTVTPITTLKDNMNDISTFVDNYNSDVISGKYNDESVYPGGIVDFEYEQGILDIINNIIKNPTYGEQQIIPIRVMHDIDKNSYYINTDDLIALNNAVIKYPS